MLKARLLLALPLALALGAIAQSANANSNPDANLYTTYAFDHALDATFFTVCGGVPGSSGCYGSGSFTGLGRIGAVMEDNPVVNADIGTVSRDVYVVDQAVAGGTKVNLVVYRITIVVNAPYATITSSKIKTIALPLTGGGKAHTFMAANSRYVFIGTDQGGTAVRVSKGSFGVSNVAGFTPSINVSAITADPYGYVDVTFGSLNGADGVHAYDPSGTSLGLSRGASFKLGKSEGLSTYGLLARQAAVALDRVRYHAQAPIAAASANPDAGLSTDIAFDPAFTSIGYDVCGALSGADGCFANGTIGGFGHVGALLWGNPGVDAAHGTVRRDLYVVDDGVGGGASTTVALNVYRFTETVGATSVAVSVQKVTSIGLALVGGTHARSWIAGNGLTLFVGTNQSNTMQRIAKGFWSSTGIGGFSPPIAGSMITADHYDNVAITFGGTTGDDGFYTFDADGNSTGDGGGADFLLGTVQSLAMSQVDTRQTPFNATGPRPTSVRYFTK